MIYQDRRQFLFASATLAAGVTFGARSLSALALSKGAVAAEFLPAPFDPATFRHLASVAVDAARTAGASYADVRLGEKQKLVMRLFGNDVTPKVYISSARSFGVRVLVDGVWGFTYGNTATTESMARAARNAAAQAAGYAKVAPVQIELAPAPVATGEWANTVELPPFTVPLLDQADLMGAFASAFNRVRGIMANATATTFNWATNMEVFASTEGALTTQTTFESRPRLMGLVIDGPLRTFRGFLPSLAGFEQMLDPDFEEQIKAFAEESVRLSQYPERALDVGRYPVVFDGGTMGDLIGQTMAPACELDRVLGHEANGVGTSYLSPPAKLLGTTVAASSVNLSADRNLPGFGAVKWDADGVEPEPVTLIRNGTLVDYLTTRATAPALTDWYLSQQQSMRSHGYSVATAPNRIAMPVASQVTMAPGATPARIEDLIRDIPRGALVIDGKVAQDQALATGFISGGSSYNQSLILEIEKGKITHRLNDIGLQFRTGDLWKSLAALGDEHTVVSTPTGFYKGQPSQRFNMSITTPAALFPAVDAVRFGVRR